MDRRKFIQNVTAGVAVFVPATAVAGVHKTVTYQVTGFTCITCAVGLDTLLGKEKGIVRSKSTYPGGVAVVEFDADLISETQIVAFIEELGFKARLKSA